MIGYLQGTVITNTRNPLILDVHGVGYAVHVTETLLAKAHPKSPLALHIHTLVREEALDLYGFAAAEEVDLFRLLLSVSGIGPRTSLAIMNRGVADIRKAVNTADTEFFTDIPRLGKKNAQKIIIELKTKIGSLAELDLSEPGEDTSDLIEALTGMGFARAEILRAIKQLPDTTVPIAEKIRQTLRLMGGKP